MVGILDRDEGDVSLLGVRTDALSDEPIVMGTCFMAAEAALYPAKPDIETKPMDILDSVLNFDWKAYLALIICVYLTGFVMIAVSKTTQWRKASKLFWRMLETIIGQENYQPIKLPTRVIWLSFM